MFFAGRDAQTGSGDRQQKSFCVIHSRLGLRKPCLLRLVVMACVVMLLLLLLLRSWPEAGVRGVVGDRLFAIASIIVPDSDCFFPAASQVQVVACARGMFG